MAAIHRQVNQDLSCSLLEKLHLCLTKVKDFFIIILRFGRLELLLTFLVFSLLTLTSLEISVASVVMLLKFVSCHHLLVGCFTLISSLTAI